MLFLAVSGFLIMIAFAGLSGRINKVRFTDSMRSLESFFESEESKVRNGAIDAPSLSGCAAGSNPGDCVVMGTSIQLTSSSGDVNTRTLVGNRLTPEQLKGSLSDAITASVVQQVSLSRTYTIDWGVIYHGLDVTIGFLRDPRASSILPFYGNPADPASINRTTPELCFRDNVGNSAKIIFGGSGNSQGVELKFEDC